VLRLREALDKDTVCQNMFSFYSTMNTLPRKPLKGFDSSELEDI
jgi:hypothetical protein